MTLDSPAAETAAAPVRLGDRIQRGADADAMLEIFIQWAEARGLVLYPAQEEALLELFAGRHVILKTPTGSGKSLVALAVLFKALCEGKRAYYTAPIKALVSEKFFGWCEELGAANVGMLTGDASIHPQAPIICCTAEILANQALREGRWAAVDYAVLDEFHYYGDRDRGVAWQIPLLELPDALFVLMSATLGDMGRIAESLEAHSGRSVATVSSRDRPVPLDYSYRDTALHRTMLDLAAEGRLPVYIVNFTQREAAEQAQSLTSQVLVDKEERRAVATAMAGFRFDTPYGKDMRRILGHGIGLHHAGLLPKYRLLVERLAQQGLLKAISGTDTLGVGVNVPIRTVLFTKLYKFDGQKTGILRVRDFQQIAGRAGRRGFDVEGSVVCLAPEHVVENKALDLKEQGKGKKKPRKKPPPHYVAYNEATFRKLIDSEPEPLASSFAITHGALTQVMDRGVTAGRRDGGYRRIVDLIGRSHESPRAQSQHRRHAARLFRSLRNAGVIERVVLREDGGPPRPHVRIGETLQREFSLHHTLSLYLVDAISQLDPALDDHALDVLSVVESILESPRAVLLRQIDKAKGSLVAELKAQGVPYEERMERLQEVTHPKPRADFIYATFDLFREAHPWVRQDNVRPKSIARDMVERFASFNEYVRDYGLQRSEGVLLRYLTEAYKVLVQTVPEQSKSDDLHGVIAFLRAALEQVDSSLVREWESLLESGQAQLGVARPVVVRDIARDPRMLSARLRAESHRLLKALADRDYEEATLCVRQPAGADEGSEAWSAERFAEVLEPYYVEHERIIFNHRARLTEFIDIAPAGPRRWRVRQTLLDPADENGWCFVAEVDLSSPEGQEGLLLRLVEING